MTPLSLSPAPQTLTVPLPRSSLPARPSDKSVQHWRVTSHFQYRPRGPVIHFLNDQLIDAVVEAFLLQAPRGRQMRSSGEARKDVNFFPISRADVHHVKACESLCLGGQYRDSRGREEK